MRLLECDQRQDRRYILTVEFGSLLWWTKPTVKRYVGSRTVWHEYPSGKRASTSLEGSLCDLLEGWKFQGEELARQQRN